MKGQSPHAPVFSRKEFTMAKIVLIGCSKTKSPKPAPARDFYQGDLFKKSLAWAERHKIKTIFVLSAKYGLVPLDKRLSCYNETLNEKPAEERKEWAENVFKNLAKKTNLKKDEFTILAGKKYYQYLFPHFAKKPYMPITHMRNGQAMNWLDNN
jgi:hypothetical protein